MRINKFIAAATGMSRRKADQVIADGRVRINGQPAQMGSDADSKAVVTLDMKPLSLPTEATTIMLNKPVGYVVSRRGQGSQTIYELLPPELQQLKPVGRLDKHSSGLLLLTTDGQLANALTHPSHHKLKRYHIRLQQSLQPLHRQMIEDVGIQLEDGPSKLQLSRLQAASDKQWEVRMYEGRNRQIRRTFQALGYQVSALHRIQFGEYQLGALAVGQYKHLSIN